MDFCSCHLNTESCVSLVPIFSLLSDEELKHVASITTHKTYSKGEKIYLAGDVIESLFIVNDGKVKINKYSESGKEQVLMILKSGDFMGEFNLFSKAPLEENAFALTDVTICIIQRQHLQELLKKYPSITFKIIEELSSRLNYSQKLLKNISVDSVEKRVADILISLVDHNNVVKLEMTKKDLASMIGMSAESLSRQLAKLEKQRIIKQSKNKIYILNLDYLLDI